MASDPYSQATGAGVTGGGSAFGTGLSAPVSSAFAYDPNSPSVDEQMAAFGQGGIDPSAEAGGADQSFRAQVVQYFANHGITDPAVIDQFASRLWQAPTIRTTFADGNGLASANQGEIAHMLGPKSPDQQLAIDYLQNLPTYQLTSSEQRFLTGNVGQGVTQVIQPFGKVGISGYTFGQVTGDPNEPIHNGVDYGVPDNTQLMAPVPGVVHIQPESQSGGYGNLVTLEFGNGWKIRMGHLSQFDVRDGEQVAAGQLLGLSGGDPGQSGAGYSSGAHVHFELIDPNGSFQDPAKFMDPAWSGTTYNELAATFGNLLGGKGVLSNAERAHQEGLDGYAKTTNPGAVSAWKKYFGTEPNQQQITDIAAHGSDVRQMDDYVRSFGSHIDGMNIGQYSDLRSLVDATSLRDFGHQGTDSIVKNLYDQGLGTPSGVSLWYEQLAGKRPADLDNATYNAIFAANRPYYTNYLNEPQGQHPAEVFQQFHSAVPSGGPSAAPAAAAATPSATPASDASAAANALPTPPPPPAMDPNAPSVDEQPAAFNPQTGIQPVGGGAGAVTP